MKQFKFVASLCVSGALLSPVAFAHVLTKDEPLINWTGFYAGLNAGAVKHTMNMTDNQASSFNATIQQASDPNFTGGFQAGYRRQLALSQASGVYGLEFSADFSNAKFKQQYGSPFALYQFDAENTLKNLGLLQLIGGIAADRTFVFLAAGFSWTDISGSITNLDNIAFFESFNVDKTGFGTAVGAGIEYAFTDKISARFKMDVITPGVYTTANHIGDTFLIANSVVQATVGVNYRFG